MKSVKKTFYSFDVKIAALHYLWGVKYPFTWSIMWHQVIRSNVVQRYIEQNEQVEVSLLGWLWCHLAANLHNLFIAKENFGFGTFTHWELYWTSNSLKLLPFCLILCCKKVLSIYFLATPPICVAIVYQLWQCNVWWVQSDALKRPPNLT